MARTRWIALVCLLLSCVLSALWGFSMERASPNLMIDFKAVYYATRCLLLHHDPYNVDELDGVYRAESGDRPSETVMARQIVTININLPTTYVFIAPFALLPWGPAQMLWTILGVGSLIFAAFLVWNSGASDAPVISCCLICFLLANTEAFFTIGNTSGIVVSLCAIAVCCFLRERFGWAGVLCLAACLAIKPHDAGLVWLYFLLAGGNYRKRALQTLVVSAVLSLAAILWVTPIAPHWSQELHSNIEVDLLPSGLNNPGPATIKSEGPDMIIDLQSVAAAYRDDPRIYNPVSYIICGSLLLAWVVQTLRVRFTQTSALLALAAVVPLTMLITYHRVHDSKLLLLAVPACAMLWAGGGLIRWLALLVTSAGIVFTADIPLTILRIFTDHMHISTAELSGQILAIIVTRPVPLILLAMSIFYMWIYLQHDPARSQP